MLLVANLMGGFVYHELWYGKPGEISQFLGLGLASATLFVSLANAWGLYRLPFLLSPRQGVGRLLVIWAGVLLLLTCVFFLSKAGASFSRGGLIGIGILGVALLVPARRALGTTLSLAIRSDALRGRRAVLLGTGDEFRTWTASRLMRQFGIDEVGRVALESRTDGTAAQLNEVDSALEVARKEGAEEVIVALSWSNTTLLEFVRNHLAKSPLPVRLLPCQVVRSVLRMGAGADRFSALIELQRAPLSRTERALKRAFDVTTSAVGLLLLSPLLTIVALAIKCESAGPVIFKQRRNGFNGNQFVIFKFRTMVVLEDGARVPQATREDPRVTRVGRLLRRWSIDELPQLLNVMRGDMSLVGPRPHALAHDREYIDLVSDYAFRHHVKPGMTGWAQVNGFRGETRKLSQMVERVKYDLWYINNWSIWLDFRVTVRTCVELLKGHAY